MKVVIMAGGMGTRISSIAADIPKPMIKINQIPVLEHEINSLRMQGFTDLIITVSHLGNIIMDYFGDGTHISPVTGKPFGVKITYYNEEKPLGNAGALFKLRHYLTEDFFLLNADALFDVDLSRMIRFHKEKEAWITIFTHPNTHPYDSGLVIANKKNVVEKWLNKEEKRPDFYKNRVNAGIHIINPVIFNELSIDENAVGTERDGKAVKIDLDRQIIKPLVETGRVYCYDSPEYVKDMGVPERFTSVVKDYLSGYVQEKNLLKKQKAIFLDRDGTINKYVGFLRKEEYFELIEGAAEAVRLINQTGYLCIVVTNQPVVARGEVTEEQLELIHDKMETLLGYEGGYVDHIYYCPHHPDKGYQGEIEELKIECNCRKPKAGMLFQAMEDYNIDLKESWMVGDSEIDIKAGKNAGCKTALIGKGNFEQDMTIGSLLEFVEKIIKGIA